MFQVLRTVAWFRALIATSLGVLILCFGGYYLLSRPSLPTGSLTLTAGRATGQRHHLAEMLVEHGRSLGREVRLIETAGSEEALDRVDSGRIDAALIQGGLKLAGRTNIRQVAALYVEPLHLLVRADGDEVHQKDLTGLRGKRINLSEPGSGTYTLSLAVLAFAGLQPPGPDQPGDFTPITLSYSELMAADSSEDLPDAVFMVMSLPSPVADHLITRHDYRLVPLPFAKAFALDGLSRGEAQRDADEHAVRKSYIYDTVIPPYTYCVQPAAPAEPVHTLGTRLLLIAHKDVDAGRVERAVGILLNSPFAQVVNPPLSPQLLELPPEFPLHEGTKAYLERNKPLIAADLIDYWDKVLAVTASVLGGMFFLWQGWRHWSAQQREQQFKGYLVSVAQIEQQVLEQERAAQLNLRSLLELQESLNKIKDEALQRFASGELQGEQLVAGFLTLVNDTRSYLMRLILHQRENVEQLAAHQGRNAQELWQEAYNAASPERSVSQPAKPAKIGS